MASDLRTVPILSTAIAPLRRRIPLSQDGFAAAVGVSPATIKRIEQSEGISNVYLTTAANMATALNMTFQEFLAATRPPDDNDAPAPIPITRPKPPSIPGVIRADEMGIAASHDRDAERAARRGKKK